MRTKSSSKATSTLTSLQLAIVLFGICATVVTFFSVSLTHGIRLSLLEHDNPVEQALESFSSPQPQQKETLDLNAVYPHEDPIPNPPPASGYDTFSACLLVMDDNHRLTEWLAYHYHVLPLRYLVVTADPRSKTSPAALLNAWRRRGMFIVQWTDRDFWKPSLRLEPIPDDADLQTKRDRHRGRQKFFYRKCLIHMQHHNRTYVALHDTDEYLVYNHAGGADETFAKWQQKMEGRHARSKFHEEKRVSPSKTPPSTALEGGMIQYIRQERDAGLHFFQSPCIGVPRLQFGAVESTREELDRHVPPELLPSSSSSLSLSSTDNSYQRTTTTDDAALLHHLDTMRWRKHAPRNDFVKNALGKVLMDVSRVDVTKTPQFMSLHRPIKSICAAPWHNEWDSGLRINHYLGSWESYSFRDDARRGFERSRDQWEYKSSTNADRDDDNIRPWLSGFVQTHGIVKAKEMLEAAGLPKGYRLRNPEEWQLLPDKLDKILSTDVTVANDGKMVAFDAFVREKYKKSENNAMMPLENDKNIS
jgi:hypothetical protein